MIDIVTVVFQEELPILRIQAQSIALYCQNIGIRNIYVVVNDDDSVMGQIDSSWWGPLADRVIVTPRTVFSTPFVENGWVSQQVLKILAASISYNTYSMILDAKTVFVRELDPATIVDESGRIQTGRLSIYPVFEPSRKIVNELFDIDLQQQIGPGGVPFIFHNDTVRFMIADVTFATRQTFPTWFQNQGLLTEFLLYSGYVQMRCGDISVLYSDTEAIGTPVNISHDEVAQFDTKMQQMKSQQTITVSIHRGAWAKLTDEQRTQYRNFLIDRGIVVAWDLA